MHRTAPVSVLLSDPARLLWAVHVRWLVIGGFLLLAIAAHAGGLFGTIMPCATAAVIGAAMNAINHWCVERRRWLATVTAVAIPLDHVLITYVVVSTGGVHSPFLMMYVVQVLATAMLVDTRVAAGSAVLALGLLFAGVQLHAAGVIRGVALFAAHAFGPQALLSRPALYQTTWAAFLLYCLALLVYLGGYISSRLRASERDLAEKNRSLKDALASLHSAHTELRAAYDRLMQTEAHLIQSEKMRGLGEMVAGVAHELNNPLSFISGNVEHLRTYLERITRMLDAYAAANSGAALARLRTELKIDTILSDLPTMLADCEEGARRSKRIIGQLRTFSRTGERETWQAADLNQELQNTIALMAHRLKHRIEVHTDWGELPPVECLAGQLNQVFMNLLSNAADAIGARAGNIWVTTRRDGDAQVRVSIRDDGTGIPAEIQSRIFEPFFTTKPPGQGTGLGLSVSYGIVAHHHGTIEVDSQPNAGATFTVALPVRQAAAASHVA